MADTYKIIRFYQKSRRRKIIRRGVSLETARAHCSREDTRRETKAGRVIWMDGFTKE